MSTKKGNDIAVIGMACWYPGAKSLLQLWENVLARRQEFRRIPDSRLPMSDYYSANKTEPDKSYGTRGAYIDGFDFDWVSEKFPKTTFDSTDIVQWLALDVASKALHDAGMDRKTVVREKTGVIIGNSLTGEFSRSNGLRLRWPYVKKVLLKSIANRGFSAAETEEFLKATEDLYKSVLAPQTADTLAGNMSNIIAGRICNYFNFDGGGFVIDGACSSSLLAVANAATSLSVGDLNMAIVGGVDVSLDTAELIGFSKVGALTDSDMKVYDRNGNGFIGGEGCGMIVLKRLEDAVRDGNKVYAVVKGWGVSSDGSGGITTPKATGQSLALKRAYERAGYKPADCDFIEGHGTGTTVGDKIELQGIGIAMEDMGGSRPRGVGITSLKSIIGHTKAAAGIGALIKTVIAVNRRVLPPTAGCDDPNPVFGTVNGLFPLMNGEIKPENQILRAGISAMGFGGINSHVTLESYGEPHADLKPDLEERSLLVSSSDCEIFFLTSQTIENMKKQVQDLLQEAPHISIGELADFSAAICRKTVMNMPYRAAFLAGSVKELEQKLSELQTMLAQPPAAGESSSDVVGSIWLSNKKAKPKIGFLFPGQGSQRLNMSRILVERHPWAQTMCEEIDAQMKKWVSHDKFSAFIFRPVHKSMNAEEVNEWTKNLTNTEIAQPAICLSSILWAHRLAEVGISANVVGGHSLGELTALSWAGAFDYLKLIELAAERGKQMASDGEATMMSLSCSSEIAEEIVGEVNRLSTKEMPASLATDGNAALQMQPLEPSNDLVIANINGLQQIVISGTNEKIAQALSLASSRGVIATRLNVSNAFHSPLVAMAAQRFAQNIKLSFNQPPLKVPFISGVDGQSHMHMPDLKQYLCSQITSPVKFTSVIEEMSRQCDLMIEVGPGAVLTGLTNSYVGKNRPGAIAVESRAEKQSDFLKVVARYFASGGNIQVEKLFANRMIRPFEKFSQKRFFINPCEIPFPDSVLEDIQPTHQKAAVVAIARPMSALTATPQQTSAPVSAPAVVEPPRSMAEGSFLSKGEVEEILLETLTGITGFPKDVFKMNMRLLDDLNLDSIKAGEAITKMAALCKLENALDPIQIANSNLGEIVDLVVAMKPRRSAETSIVVQSKSAVTAPVSTQSAASASVAIAGSVMSREQIKAILIDSLVSVTGFPAETFKMNMRLLDDLNLDSIKAGEVISDIAARCSLDGSVDPIQMANSNLDEIIDIIVQMKSHEPAKAAAGLVLPATVAVPEEKAVVSSPPPALVTTENLLADQAWVRNFTVKMVARKREQPQYDPVRYIDQWPNAKVLIVHDGPAHPLTESLSSSLLGKGASVTALNLEEAMKLAPSAIADFTYFIFLLPSEVSENGSAPERLKSAVQRMHFIGTAANNSGKNRRYTTIATVQCGDGKFGQGLHVPKFDAATTSAFLQTLIFERNDIRARSFEVSLACEHTTVAENLLQELTGAQTFAMVGFDTQGQRYQAEMDVSFPSTYTSRGLAWGKADVMLVTGGAKGVTAACATAFAKKNHVKLAILGSSPYPKAADENGQEMLEHFQRLKAEGIEFKYYTCDVADSAQVEKTVRHIEKDLGVVTAILHGAGKNSPRRTSQVSVELALDEISPKVLGALNLAKHVPAERLKLFVGLTSIIGVQGGPGNAWYGYSNEAVNTFLLDYGKKHANVQIVTLAYGLWDGIGMGVRLNSLKKLKQFGMTALSTEEGVARFLELTANTPGAQQVIVTSKMPVYGFQNPNHKIQTSDKRFLENIKSFLPGVEAVCRVHLTLQKDLYLRDHKYQGNHLFPTVFGLEAMAQVAMLTLGVENFESVTIENLELASALIVNASTGTEIEISGLADEVEPNPVQRSVRVGIRSENTQFAKTHFSATFKFHTLPLREQSAVVPPTGDLGIDVKNEVYGALLFHGPDYQRIEKLHHLDAKNVDFSCRQESLPFNQALAFADPKQTLVLGDPYFRDSLMQGGQCITPQSTSLPLSCGKIVMYSVRATAAMRWGHIELNGNEGNRNRYHGFVVDEHGLVLERWTQIKSVIVKTNLKNPSVEILARGGKAKPVSFTEQMKVGIESLGSKAPIIVHQRIQSLAQMTINERHIAENELLQATMKAHFGATTSAELCWQPSGKPYLKGSHQNQKLSFSHVGDECVLVLAPNETGCDLELVTARDEATWMSLLGPQFAETLKTLMALAPIDVPLNILGTMVWSAREAAGKAFDSMEFELTSLQWKERGTVFGGKCGSADIQVFSYAITMDDSANEYVFSLALVPPNTTFDAVFYSRKFRQSYALDLNQMNALCARWPVTFKEASSVQRAVHFTKYFEWQGRVRELAILPMLSTASDIFKSGEFGWVTNNSETRILRSVEVGDVVEARLRMGPLHGRSNSSVNLYFDWYRVGEDGSEVLIAQSRMLTTWVRVIGHGVVEVASFPQEFVQFFAMAPHSEDEEMLQLGASSEAWPTLYTAPPGIGTGPLLTETVFSTALEESNLVGNIYFSNYSSWLGKTRDAFFHKMAPEAISITSGGEMFCVHSYVNHLRELMPFEQVMVQMKLKSFTATGGILYFEFFKYVDSQKAEKLAYGEHEFLWVQKSRDQLVVGQMPDALMRCLKDAVANSETLKENKKSS
jgi:acyl transferase domain-containing protein/NAD(P)-dependent dehydrogenase (short-subunit alcohol dehydrogenase family)/acyl-CoA thioesterase FadM